MSSGAFDLLDRPLVFVPVKWPGIGQTDDGAAIAIEHVVEVQVELLDRDEFAEWIVDANKDIVRRTIEDDNGDTIVDPTDARTDAEIRAERAAHELAQFKRVAKGWRKIKAGGRAVEFNDENIAKLLRWPGFVTAFGSTYMDAWRGEVATREGNSAGSPANGQAGEPTDATPKAETPKS